MPTPKERLTVYVTPERRAELRRMATAGGLSLTALMDHIMDYGMATVYERGVTIDVGKPPARSGAKPDSENARRVA